MRRVDWFETTGLDECALKIHRFTKQMPDCANGAPPASKTGNVDVMATFLATSVLIVSCTGVLLRSSWRRLFDTPRGH